MASCKPPAPLVITAEDSSSQPSTSGITKPPVWPRPLSPVNTDHSVQKLIDSELAKRAYIFASTSNFEAELGFTSEGVAQQINFRYGSTVKPPVSGSMVYLFESGALPAWEMNRMKVCLEKWLIDTECARGVPEDQARELAQAIYKSDRKKRTYIDTYHRFRLEQEFEKNNRPTRKELQDIVKNIGSNLITVAIVRVWFCNKRMKLKAATEGGTTSSTDESSYWPKPENH